jgi:hypothetical protein
MRKAAGAALSAARSLSSAGSGRTASRRSTGNPSVHGPSRARSQRRSSPSSSRSDRQGSKLSDRKNSSHLK